MSPSPEQQRETMLANLPDKTGKPLGAWLTLIRAQHLTKHGQIVKFLKSEHGVTHGFANLIAHQVLAAPTSRGEDDLLDAQYAGAKAALRPILDTILAAVGEFGSDVEIAPKKASVSLRRAKQFALVQPSTKTRVDVGLQLPGVEAAARLEASGSFSAMVSHRVRLASADEVDRMLIGWLRDAYERAG
ncbi:MAG: DUF4287 domain-containing protein [Pseudomonadota bacterium]